MEQTNDVIIERLDNFIRENSEEHKALLEQTTKTNGTVADIQRWRYMLTGGFIISNIIIVPILIAMIMKFF